MGYRSPIGVPEQALGAGGRDGPQHLLVLYTAENAPSGAEGVADGVAVVRELLRALRLFGDGRIALGARAWARVGEGQWSTLALGGGGRSQGVLLVTAEQEDELRAFCNLVSRRSPHASTIAWALRRFELGCERESEYEGLSDHLLALKALLGAPSELDPDRVPDGLLAGRLSALCAAPEHRAKLSERTLAAIDLERKVIAGSFAERAGGFALVRELSDHLRALLRDVICGHLRPELAQLADEILLSPGELDDELGAPAPSGEEQLGDKSDPAEVLRVAV